MISKDREYRAFQLEVRSQEEGSIVEGYAAVFENETVLYSYDGIDYKEVLDRHAFDEAEMVDVVMNYNHGGKPVARTKNNTLELKTDDTGLHIRADLSGTEEGRKLYEEIKGGYIDKMSFAFNVNEESYNKETHTRRITKVGRLYDVAAVDLPAYDATSISARDYFSAEAEMECAEARRAKKDAIKKELLKMIMEDELNA